MNESSAKVLVVDDERRFVEAHRRWLEDDYEVQTAVGGEAALELIDEDIDVLLLDRQMPNVSGMEVLNEVRERELGCIIIFISSVKPEPDIIESEFDDYLIKPTGKEVLIEKIEHWLDVRGQSDRRKYLVLDSKRTLLETHTNPQSDADEVYTTITERLDKLEDTVSAPDKE